MNKPFCAFQKWSITFTCLVSFLVALYFPIQASILLTYDDRYSSKDIIDGIKDEISTLNLPIEECKVSKIADLDASVRKSFPQMIIIIGESAVETYKKYTTSYNSISDKIPSISITPRYNHNLDNIPNNIGIYYEAPVSLCIEKLSALSGKKIKRVGIIHRAYLAPFIRQSKIACEKSGLSIVSYSLPDKNPNLTSDINKYLHTLKRMDLVDALYIPNDEVLLRPSIIQNSWKLTLLKYPMLVVVCNKSYLESNEGMSALCITPDYKAIGAAVGKKVKQIESAQWKLNNKGFTQAPFYKSMYEGNETKVAYAAPRLRNAAASQRAVEKKPLSEPTITVASASVTKSQAAEDPTTEVQSAPVAEIGTPNFEQPENAENTLIVDHAPIVAANQMPNKNSNFASTNEIAPEVKRAAHGTSSFNRRIPKKVEQILREPKRTQQPIPDAVLNQVVSTADDSTLTTTAQIANTLPKPIQSQEYVAASTIVGADATGFPWIYIVIAGVLIALGIVLLIALYINKRRSESALFDKTCVIISRLANISPRFLNNDKNDTIDSFFKSIGFKVRKAKNINDVRKSLSRDLPDVLCIDWEFSPTIHSYICNRIAPSGKIIIFFNTVEFYKIKRNSQFKNVYYIGKMFLLDELHQIVAPILDNKYAPATNQSNGKAVRNNLEGEIFEDSLFDFLQMIDIGKRTGCLILEQEKPFGMLFFENGRIVYAVTTECQGKNAVFKILALQQGHFKFLINSLSKNKNIDLGIMETIIDWAQCHDEIKSVFPNEIVFR